MKYLLPGRISLRSLRVRWSVVRLQVVLNGGSDNSILIVVQVLGLNGISLEGIIALRKISHSFCHVLVNTGWTTFFFT